MSIPYRTRRVLNRVGTVLLTLLLIGIFVWLCWVIWLERYVVYTEKGASLDFSLSSHEFSGEVAVPPVAEENISIYYNEGSDAMNTNNELTQLNGYYIDSTMLQQEMDNVLIQIERLSPDTPIMIDMKSPQGIFFYPSNLSEAVTSTNTDIAAVSDLVAKLQKKGFYTIARISALQDYYFGLNHVPSGLMDVSRLGLWPDGNTYWLDPTNSTTTSWISSVVLELRDMGFNEVLLSKFYFPNSDRYIFTGDKDGALQTAAATLVSTCASSNFTLSFGVTDPAFALPEGRTRLYLEGVDAKDVGAMASQVTIDDPEIRLVFVSDTNDTRFDEYGILRSLKGAEVMEAQKAAQAENE